jgi:CheY-like chemotaxis protein
MLRKVLIVDDDRTLCLLIKKKLEKYATAFTPLVAYDGVQAIEVLNQHAIALVVTDLQMPNMDGFALLAHLSEHFPDIPVIIITAYGSPAIHKAVLESGAASYIEKPFVIEDLGQKILAVLRKQSDGGVLQTVPLEMFTQLIEMEQKTCTLRVFHKTSKKMGVLFFRDGQLLNARIDTLQGNAAAYRIFSWDKVTLSIQDTCPVEEKKIEGDLQAVLFDAMRLKDEGQEHPPQMEPQEATSDAAPVAEPTTQAAPLQAPPAPAPPAQTPPAQEVATSAAERIERRLAGKLGAVKGIIAVREERTLWRVIMSQAAWVIERFGGGRLKACYLSRGQAHDLLLLPEEGTTVVVELDPKIPRERLIKAAIE